MKMESPEQLAPEVHALTPDRTFGIPGLSELLWGRQLDTATFPTGEDPKKWSDQELAEYERYAVQGLVELLPVWCEKGGMGGVMGSLFELVKQVDVKALELQGQDDERSSLQRHAAANILTTEMIMNRGGMMEAVMLAAGAGEPPATKPNRAARRAKK